MTTLYFLGLDASGVVVSLSTSNLAQDGMTAVDAETYAAAALKVGRCRYAGGALSDYAPPSPPVDLRGYAASARYAKETAGITVGTAQIATDRDSQGMITGMWAAAQINPQIQVSFKSASGFVVIGPSQVARIAAAVASYVQACFAAEAEVVAGIAAGTVKTTADVDAAFAGVGTGATGPTGGTGATGSSPSSGA